MLENLNDEQIKLMDSIRDKWIKKLTDTLDKKKAKSSIEWLYKFCGLEKPTIVFVDSPLGIQYAVNMVAGENMNQVGNQVENQVWNEVRNQVCSQVGNQVGNQVWSEVRNQVRNQVGNQVENQVWNEVGNQVGNQKLNFYSFCRYGDIDDFGWVSFYDFFEDIKIFKNKDFTKFKKLFDCGIYTMVQALDFVVVCGMPKYIHRNTQGSLHSETDKAIEFSDGWGLHCLNGVFFPEDLFTKVVSKKISFQDILNITDIDQRRQAMKYGNWDEFVSFTHAIKLDEFLKFNREGNPVIHQLWEFPFENDEEKRIFSKIVYFARYQDRTTGEWFMKGVPEFKTVAEAMAWGMSDDERTITPAEWKILKIGINES